MKCRELLKLGEPLPVRELCFNLMDLSKFTALEVERIKEVFCNVRILAVNETDMKLKFLQSFEGIKELWVSI